MAWFLSGLHVSKSWLKTNVRALNGQSDRTRVCPRYWTKADKAAFWPVAVCPLMTQSGH
jgi:hypothetical protein